MEASKEKEGPLSAYIAFFPGCRGVAQNVTFFAADNNVRVISDSEVDPGGNG